MSSRAVEDNVKRKRDNVRIGALAALLLASVVSVRAGWIFDGRPSTWEGIPEELKAEEMVYPVFLLPLGGAWTDFEIKASTNNFASIVYYYKSWTASQHATNPDPGAWVFFSDDHAGDVRVWIRKTADSVSEMLSDPLSVVEYVIFMPSRDHHWEPWMSRHNPDLVWSFVRFDYDYEMNASGTRQHWNPVQPLEWRRERYNP